jgi:hypothetical protein
MSCLTDLNAQEGQVMKCQMTLDEILSVQPYNMDQPEFKKAKSLAEILLNTFELFYLAVNKNDSSEINMHKTQILAVITSAEIIKMDYSMFNEDLDFMNKYDFNK